MPSDSKPSGPKSADSASSDPPASVSSPAQSTGPSFERLAQHLRSVPHAAMIGMEVDAWSDDGCTVRLPYSEHLVGDPDSGVIHGGVLTAVLDNTMGMAVHSGDLNTAARAIATLDLRIDYMRPAEPQRDVFARAHCYRKTRNVAFVRALAFHETEDDPIATAVAAFMLGTPNQPRES